MELCHHGAFSEIMILLLFYLPHIPQSKLNLCRIPVPVRPYTCIRGVKGVILFQIGVKHSFAGLGLCWTSSKGHSDAVCPI